MAKSWARICSTSLPSGGAAVTRERSSMDIVRGVLKEGLEATSAPGRGPFDALGKRWDGVNGQQMLPLGPIVSLDGQHSPQGTSQPSNIKNHSTESNAAIFRVGAMPPEFVEGQHSPTQPIQPGVSGPQILPAIVYPLIHRPRSYCDKVIVSRPMALAHLQHQIRSKARDSSASQRRGISIPFHPASD
ncbi:hypothetical protein DOTSEDRAFT_38108 [Dothistroma septosporum NZE10]|uniref:Uncharacterized protein n=1 Tax=Dothistroma septosporum (strain NZE10 / CBS 128990) TaxID=675120 RepID=N1PFN8_DOTSN|nr:hypothetical protein DOTSEDRAFT_38108 [Dothistroma septosporum NZE10]